jgi:hypothetical protein
MNKIIKKGSIVRNGYDPRILGEVVGFKILKGKRIPLVKYGEQIVLDKSSITLASTMQAMRVGKK